MTFGVDNYDVLIGVKFHQVIDYVDNNIPHNTKLHLYSVLLAYLH